MKNILKKIMVFTVYVTTFGASVAIFAGNLLYRFAIGSRKRRQISSNINILEQGQDVYITSEDGLLLHAIELPVSVGGLGEVSGNYAILCHGYKGRAADMGEDARIMREKGFHVLVPDARGHGESEGNYIGMGWKERRDIIDWVRRLIQKDADARIILYGVSMGAATVMMASGENDLPVQVKAIVEDCGYTSVWDEFELQIRKKYHLPVFPFLHAARYITKHRAGYDFKEASAVAQVAKSKTPILFIHGGQDTFVPFEMMETLYEAAGCEKEKLVMKDARHAQSSVVEKKRYWETVFSFLNKYLEEK